MRYSASLLLMFVGIAACEGDAGPAGPPGEDSTLNMVSGTFTVAPSVFVNGFWHFPVAGGTKANPAKVACTPSEVCRVVPPGARPERGPLRYPLANACWASRTICRVHHFA